MRVEILVQTLADLLVAMELADQDEVSPEAASELYNLVAASLYRLTEQEKAEVVTVLQSMAAAENNDERATILASLPEDLGLTE